MFLDFVEYTSYLATSFLVIIAYKGLDQLRLTKKGMEDENRREQVKMALEEVRRFELLIEEWNKLTPKIEKELQLKGKAFGRWQLESYTIQEISEGGKELSDDYNALIEVLKSNPDIDAKVLEVANKIETIAAAFTTKAADEDVAFGSMGEAYCTYIETIFFQFCFSRHKKGRNLYDRTIELYKLWSKRLVEMDNEKPSQEVVKGR